MIKTLKKIIPERHPIRLFYHKMLAVIAAIIYGFPSKNLAVIGVTGTKGKTTTTNLIAGILTEAGYRVGMTSTINFQVANYNWINESKMTTLSPFFLQKMLRQMVNARCQFAVIEVSSHALIQNRVWGINFDTAVLTNIGEDHLDYHGGFREYLRAKGLLFGKINRSARKPKIAKTIILNKDDENFAYFDQFKAEKRYDFGLKGGACSASNLKYSQTGVDFTLHVPNNQLDISMKMPGEFSVYNALAGAAVALANGINVSVIKTALEKASTVAGRFEQIDCGQNFAVIVDYAHTEESLKSLLELYKNQTPGKLITVFGATGGGRDKAKRSKMGAAADKFSDMLILTDDDPYEESRWKIIEDISKGVNRQEGEKFWKIPTRFEAIKFALRMAEKGDTVVIAGKGAETVQAIGDEKIPWDDRKVVREILSQPLMVEL
ncbi:MAG: UDP-N-acetylmuramoyl-L-alanyl-D-glutamate--2,6-diaminopimelate ligase [Candidatus Altimarinota bacterium]